MAKPAAWMCDKCGGVLGMQSSRGLFLVNERCLGSFREGERQYECKCPACGARNVWRRWPESGTIEQGEVER